MHEAVSIVLKIEMIKPVPPVSLFTRRKTPKNNTVSILASRPRTDAVQFVPQRDAELIFTSGTVQRQFLIMLLEAFQSFCRCSKIALGPCNSERLKYRP
ncbi:MAG: hypothetical protein B7Z37_07785 [Verrucomicrobia bacterium 12-59-8]|nr:MAG: hypothetical protein B7Z37_07785 [Verrucomicrobia bacterium 12-59-8]